MTGPFDNDIKNLRDTIRAECPQVTACLAAALPIWLFSVFVFLPLAKSAGQEARFLVSIIVFLVLAALALRAAPGMKSIGDRAAVFPARRFSQRWKTDQALTYFVFRHAAYVLIASVIYLLFLPFLLSFHASIAGLVLVVLLLWMGYILLRSLPILGHVLLVRIIEG